MRANDTLWEIAARYDMTVAQLTAANPSVTPDALRPGQTLTIPTQTTSVSGTVYTVKPNDTLWEIAARFGVFVNDLLAANPGANPQRLMVGQALRIPGAPGKTAAATAPVSATYTVRPDDTLWDIAANYGLSMDDLLTANSGVDPRRLAVGQQLRIPGIAQDALMAAQPAISARQPAPAGQPAAAPEAAPQPAPPPVLEISPEAQDLLNRINEKRLAGGRPALVWNAQLGAAAQAHANDCAQRNRGSHIGSDGARLATRIERAGYAATWASENWANARGGEQAMAMWWNEPPGANPHVQNIMTPYATEIGIGIARGSWGNYFIADFGSR